MTNTRLAEALTRAAPTDATVTEKNEALVRRIVAEVINGRDLAASGEICADDVVIHVPGLELPVGLRP